ncbi:MAG: TIGR04141 family sporadically distributed protein [Nocardiopsaceae bacterium]|nr:TIGR04141 family sporadically distributed protein [Nocardiopsaceae bacterium]
MSNATRKDPPPHAARVREVTLYRLADVEPTEQGMRAVLDEADPYRQGLAIQVTRIHDMPAVVLSGVRGGERSPDWQPDAVTSTGLNLDLHTASPVVVVLLAVDGAVYAFSYGGGHHLIPRELRDPDFGRTFAACALNEATVATVDTRDMDTANRYGSTRIPRGEPMRTYGLRHEKDLVNRLKARCGLEELTAARHGGKPRFAECGDGIRTHLGVAPADLVNDIRFIAATVKDGRVQEGMRFLEDRKEVRSPSVISALWSLVESGLRDPESIGLAISPPYDAFEHLHEARSYRVRIGSVNCPLRSGELELGPLVERLRCLKPGMLAQALKDGWIRLYGDEHGQREIAQHRNLCYWLDATVSAGAEMHVLRDGRWYEYGPRYLAEADREVEELLNAESSIKLPPWPDWEPPKKGEDSPEGGYNKRVADKDSRYLCMDKKLARVGQYARNGLEVCDLLGPDNQLVHIKQASSASGLSHLFIQAKGAVESLVYEQQVREWFRRRVSELDPTRDLSGFRPRTVVFGIRLARHSTITAQELYPLAKVELYRTAVALRRCGITVEVVGIPHGD